MKIVVFFVVACLAVSCLASKEWKRPKRPGPPPPPRPPPPKRHGPNRDGSDKNGWGWNGGGPLHYDKPPRCLDPAHIPTSPYDPDFFSRQRVWYYSAGTEYGYNTYYRILNSQYATSQSQIDQMCLVSVFASGSPVINSGSGVQFTQTCTDADICYMSKDPATYDNGVDVFAALERQDSYILKTDNKSYVIYYVCNDYVHGDVQLFTTRPYFTPEQSKIFLAQLRYFNISSSQAQAGICSSPKFHGNYPHPFENYPNSAGGGNGWGQDGWQSPAPVDGWSSPSPPSGGWPSEPDHGWSDSNNGWSQSNGWSDNGWGSDPPSNGGWGQEPSGGWGWDSHNQGWSSEWEKKVEQKNEQDKKIEPVPVADAEVVAEVAQ